MNRSNRRRQAVARRMQEMIQTAVQEVMKTKMDGGNTPPSNMTRKEEPQGSNPGQEVSGIKIEHGVPIPQRSNTGYWKGIYDRMELGDSFIATPSDVHSFVYVADKYGGKTRTRTFKEGKVQKARVWVVAKTALPAS